MSKKKSTILGLAMCLSLPLVGCTHPEPEPASSVSEDTSVSSSSSTSEEPQELTPEAKAFVDYVYSIQLGENTLRDIDTAYDLFDTLDDASWNFDEVLTAYAYLEALEALYEQYSLAQLFVSGAEEISYLSTISDLMTINGLLSLYEELDETGRGFVDVEYQHERLVRIKASIESEDDARQEETRELAILNFLSAMQNVPEPEAITLDDKNRLDDALDAYDALDSKCKQDDRVVAAYARLENAIVAYEELRDDPAKQEAAIIRRFISMVDDLPAVEDIVISDYSSIDEADKVYSSLSAESKALSEVAEAYAILAAAKAKFLELYQEYIGQVEAGDFLSAVNALGEMADLEESDLAGLIALRSDYYALGEKTKQLAVCKQAIAKVESYIEHIHETFNYEEIPVEITSISFTTHATPRLQISASTNVLTQLKTAYGVSNNDALLNKVAAFLTFYDSTGVNELFKVNISSTYLTSGSTYITTIKDYLVEASKTHQEVVSGDYRIGMQFLDLTATYADTEMIKTATAAHYDFESAYGDDEEVDDGYTMVHNATEFLAISNNLAGNYRLANDINLAGIQWTNLGTFTGNLDGAGHYLINVTDDNGGDASFGIFRYINDGASVKRLGMRGKVTNAGSWAGAIVVDNQGLIQDCHIDLDISTDGPVGGIVCNNQPTGKIERCLVTSTINGAGNYTGGIAVGTDPGNQIINTYYVKERVNTQRAVGNNASAYVETGKSEAEMKVSSLFSNFDPANWVIINGVIPTLFSK